jgi:CheY-like chemotaxis protein
MLASGADALLSDIAMPGFDGLELIRTVRARDARRGDHTPAAAISAYARPEEADRALAAGFDLHLTKPIDETTLIDGMLELMRRGGSRPAAAATAQRPPANG